MKTNGVDIVNADLIARLRAPRPQGSIALLALLDEAADALEAQTELMVDDEDRVMDWFTSSSGARIARVIAFGQKVLDERFADGVFE